MLLSENWKKHNTGPPLLNNIVTKAPPPNYPPLFNNGILQINICLPMQLLVLRGLTQEGESSSVGVGSTWPLLNIHFSLHK
jgi:hypothetical protein